MLSSSTPLWLIPNSGVIIITCNSLNMSTGGRLSWFDFSENIFSQRSLKVHKLGSLLKKFSSRQVTRSKNSSAGALVSASLMVVYFLQASSYRICPRTCTYAISPGINDTSAFAKLCMRSCRQKELLYSFAAHQSRVFVIVIVIPLTPHTWALRKSAKTHESTVS